MSRIEKCLCIKNEMACECGYEKQCLRKEIAALRLVIEEKDSFIEKARDYLADKNYVGVLYALSKAIAIQPAPSAAAGPEHTVQSNLESCRSEMDAQQGRLDNEEWFCLACELVSPAGKGKTSNAFCPQCGKAGRVPKRCVDLMDAKAKLFVAQIEADSEKSYLQEYQKVIAFDDLFKKLHAEIKEKLEAYRYWGENPKIESPAAEKEKAT